MNVNAHGQKSRAQETQFGKHATNPSVSPAVHNFAAALGSRVTNSNRNDDELECGVVDVKLFVFGYVLVMYWDGTFRPIILKLRPHYVGDPYLK